MSLLVALDRDGTVIEERPYLSDPGQVRLLPNATQGIRALRRLGFKVVLVTNQSGVGRGFFGPKTVQRINERLLQLLARQGARVDAVYFCPHHPREGCPCRKPQVGLLVEAARDFGVAPQAAFVVGDKECDIEMGRRAGAITLLVKTGWGRQTARLPQVRPHYVVEDLQQAAGIIGALAAQGGRR